MVTENQPSNTNGDVDNIISDALAGIPTPEAPIPGQQTQEPPAPELGVPLPTEVTEGSVPPPDKPQVPLSPDAVALQESNAQITELQKAGQQREALLQQFQTDQRNAQIKNDSQGIAQLLINAGTDAVTANQYADALSQSKMVGRDAANQEMGRIAAARQYGQQYGVPVDILMNLPSPEAMETAAKQEARIIVLEKQISESKQAQLPAQSFDSNMGLSTGMTMAQKQAASGRGEYIYTPEEQAERRKAALNKIGR